MNDTGTGEIWSGLFPLYFPTCIYPVFANGGTTDAQQKVKTGPFMWLTVTVESWRQLQSHMPRYSLSNIRKVAINNNPLLRCAELHPFPNLHSSHSVLLPLFTLVWVPVCDPGQLTQRWQDSYISNPWLWARILRKEGVRQRGGTLKVDCLND